VLDSSVEVGFEPHGNLIVFGFEGDERLVLQLLSGLLQPLLGSRVEGLYARLVGGIVIEDVVGDELLVFLDLGTV